MTSAERIQRAFSHEESDRVPFILSVMLHGARRLGLSQEAYFSSAEAVAEAQVTLQRRYGHDAVVALYFAAIEHEAWGGTVRFFEDGPPNAGAPLVRDVERIADLVAPVIEESPRLQLMLQSIRLMRAEFGDDVPIIGAVVAPNSVPIMQLGFEAYLHVLLDRPDLYNRLMTINEPFAVAWGNAQIAAGASMVIYFDPVSSPTIIPRELYRQTGWPVARRVIAQLPVPVAVGLASGRAKPILSDLVEAGAVGVGVSEDDDLQACKAGAGPLTLIGNLNGIAMRRWSRDELDRQVARAIAAAGHGGGLVLADHHGEIPLQVPDDTLRTVLDSVERHGRYPLGAHDG